MWTAHGEGKFYSKAESLLTEAAHQNLCPIRYPSSTPRVPLEYPSSTPRVPLEYHHRRTSSQAQANTHARAMGPGTRERASRYVDEDGRATEAYPHNPNGSPLVLHPSPFPSLPLPVPFPVPSLPLLFLRHSVRSARPRCAFGEGRGALMRAGHRRALLSRWQAPRAYATSRALHPPLAVGPPLARAALGSDPSIAVGKNVPERPCVLFRQPLVDGGTKLRLCTTIILYFTLRAQRTCGCYPRCPVYYA